MPGRTILGATETTLLPPFACVCIQTLAKGGVKPISRVVDVVGDAARVDAHGSGVVSLSPDRRRAMPGDAGMPTQAR
jgi:hypothetical protein